VVCPKTREEKTSASALEEGVRGRLCRNRLETSGKKKCSEILPERRKWVKKTFREQDTQPLGRDWEDRGGNGAGEELGKAR